MDDFIHFNLSKLNCCKTDRPTWNKNNNIDSSFDLMMLVRIVVFQELFFRQ